MDIYGHLLVFLEVFTLTLTSYSGFIVVLGLLRHFIFYFILSCALFGVLFHFRVRKPPNSRVRRILGDEWGAYLNYAPQDKSSNDEPVKVVGHRACGLDAPENSISALNKMHSKGIQMVEFDILMTSDDVPIVFHDSNVFRMTGVYKNVDEMTLYEIKKLNISVKHPFREKFPNEKIPDLHEFVKLCIDKNIKMILDIKLNSKKMIQVINDLFKEFPELYDLAIVSSFDPIVIYRIRANDPEIVSSLAWRPYYYSHEEYSGEKGPSCPRSGNLLVSLYQRFLNMLHHWFLWCIGYYIVGISVILLAKDSVTREYINYWNKRGIRLIAWSVNLPSEKQYFEKSLQISYLTDTVINN